VGPDFGNPGRTDLTLATRFTATATGAAIGLLGGVLLTLPAVAAKASAHPVDSGAPGVARWHVAASQAAAAISAGSIPFSVADPDSTPRPVVTVAIGGVPLRLLLDTGSTGIRVAAGKIPAAAVRITGAAAGYGYGSGIQLHGDQADADVAIGGYHTGPLPIEVVRSTDCFADRPACPAAHGAKPAMFGRVLDGIMGVSPEEVSGLVNPLWALRDAAGDHVGRQFAVRYDPVEHGGSILLNVPARGYGLARLPETQGVRNHRPRRMVPLAEGGYDAGSYAARPARLGRPGAIIPPPDLPPSWNPHAVQTCVEGVSLPRTCLLAMFDTGTPGFALDVPGVPAGTWPAGRALAVGVPAAGWNAVFTTGPGSGVSVSDQPSAIGSGTLLGLPAFTQGPIRFDLDAGTIGFPVAASAAPTRRVVDARAVSFAELPEVTFPVSQEVAAGRPVPANPAPAWRSSKQHPNQPAQLPFHKTARKARGLPDTGVPMSAALGAVTALTALLAGIGTVVAARRHPDHEG
jgi:hypothetical protein